MVEELLVATLKAHAGLIALIGDRVVSLPIPEGQTFPVLTLNEIAGGEEYSNDGPSAVNHRLFQLTAWAKTSKAALEIRDEILDALDGKTLSGNGAAIQGIFVESTEASFEPDPRPLYRADVDLMVHFNTTV